MTANSQRSPRQPDKFCALSPRCYHTLQDRNISCHCGESDSRCAFGYLDIHTLWVTITRGAIMQIIFLQPTASSQDLIAPSVLCLEKHNASKYKTPRLPVIILLIFLARSTNYICNTVSEGQNSPNEQQQFSRARSTSKTNVMSSTIPMNRSDEKPTTSQPPAQRRISREEYIARLRSKVFLQCLSAIIGSAILEALINVLTRWYVGVEILRPVSREEWLIARAVIIQLGVFGTLFVLVFTRDGLLVTRDLLGLQPQRAQASPGSKPWVAGVYIALLMACGNAS